MCMKGTQLARREEETFIWIISIEIPRLFHLMFVFSKHMPFNSELPLSLS